MKLRNLSETKNLFSCFSTSEKLRIWNLFLIPMNDIIIASDVQKVLNISSGVFNHLREFADSGLINYDIWGKRKVYFFKDPDTEEFVKSIFQSINDEQLQIDRAEYLKQKKSGHLQISRRSYSIDYKNGRVRFFRMIPKRLSRMHQENYISNLLNRYSRALKHNRRNEISDLEIKLNKVIWDDFPKLRERFEKRFKKVQ